VLGVVSRLGRALAAAIVLALATAGAVLAQPQDIVRDIRVIGNERVENATVESYLALRRGDRFDPGALDESLRNLFATGLFEDVTVAREGDAIVVRVVENPIINRIAFEGNRRLEDNVLESEIQLRPRVVFTRQRVQEAVQRILEIYRRLGRYSARVEPQIIELDQNRVDLVFEIEEGPVTTIGGITFVGNESFSASTLRSVIQTRESAWYRFLSTDDTYDPDRLAFDQERLRRFYRARGFADFAVVSAIAELTPDGREFFLTFTLEEGPIYRFGAIEVQSQVPDVPVEELQRLIQTREGDTFNADEIEATVQAITGRLGELGYAFVNVEPLFDRDPDALTVGVTYDIREGPRVYVERINITGNVRTLDGVIRREFRLAEGDAFNAALLRRSQERLRRLDFFETVDVTTAPGSAPDRVLVNVRVTEKSTGELSFGAGFSTSDGPLGDVRLSERNLLGTGREVVANVSVSGRRQLYRFSYTQPYFLDREVATGFDVFRERTDLQSESSFDETSTGFILRANYPLTEFLRHGVRYTIRNDDIHNVDRDASRFIRDEEGDRFTSSIGQSLVYDRRDTQFLPSAGYLLRLDQEIAGLGGDERFVKHEGRAEYYYSIVPDVVASLTAAGGYVVGFGGEDVNLANRFFIGGTSFRGFDFGGIGPRDRDTDDSLGGNLYYVGSAELRFPIGLPEELRIFGRTFADVGTLTEIDVSGRELEDSGNLRVSVGVGLSWLSPLGPLSIDFAQAVRKDSGDETEFFRLSFGTRF
jgi:outer membrane protein insertion porin family